MSVIFTLWVSTPKMTFWCKVTDGIVTDCAPIVKKFIGQPFYKLRLWLEKQGKVRIERLKNK